MTTIKVNVVRRPQIKVKALVKFPANVVTQNFLTVTNSGGTYTFSVDYSLLGPGPVIDPTTAYVAVQDQTAGVYRRITLDSLLTSGLDADLQAIAALTGTGILVRTAANTWAVRTITAGASIGITNGDGVAGNPTIAVTDPELVAIAGLTSAADKLPYFTGSGTASLADFTTFARTLIDDTTQAAMRTTLGLTPGTDVQAFDSDLAALASNAGTGLWSVTGVGTGSVRTLTAPAAGITVSNGGGVAGNPTLALANDLAAVEGLASTGIARRTGTDAWSVGSSVALSELATQAAFTFVGNNTSGAAVPTAVDIHALTLKASPAGTDEVIISDQAASGAWKRSPVSSLASASGVASLNGQTGALVQFGPPQGRLTVATGVAVMTSTVSGANTVYYTPSMGNLIPIYDGTNMVPTVFTERSQLTTDATKSPAAATTNSNYDIFVWNDAGTIRATRGPLWSSNTSRGTGAGTSELVLVNGIYLNNVSITNGPAASRGTYVGTIRTNGSSLVDYIIGGSASGGTAASLGVWNMYNRNWTSVRVIDSGASYTYTTDAPRQARASAGNQASAIWGLAVDTVSVNYSTRVDTAAVSGAFGWIGIGEDSTTANELQRVFVRTVAAVVQIGSPYLSISKTPLLGFHRYTAIENGDNVNASTFNGDPAGSIQMQVWN